MPIDIQPPNYSGLANLAGKAGNLNIAPTGALGLQALQQQQANQAALRANQLGHMQLQQQGQLALGTQRIAQQAMDQQSLQQQRQGVLDQSNLALRQQELGAAGAQNAVQNAYNQQQLAQKSLGEKDQLDLQNRILAETTAKDQMTKLMAENKAAIHEKGAYAAYSLLSMSGAKTPEEAAQIRNEIIKEAVDKKFMTSEEAKVASSMPISQFINGIKYKLLQYGNVKEYTDLKDADKEKSTGSQTITLPDGTVIQSVDPTSAAKTKAQETVNDRSLALQKIGKMQKDFNAKYFTDLDQAKNWVSKQAERKKGIPVLGDVYSSAATYATGKNEEDRGKDVQKFTKYLNSVEQFFNQTYKQPMTGAAVGKEELKALREGYISGDMSASEAKGALDQLVEKFVGEEEFNKNFLRKGADVTASNNELRAHLKQKGYSDQEINDYLKGK